MMVRPWFPPHGPHDSGNPMELTPRIGAFGSFTAHIAGGITLQWRKGGPAARSKNHSSSTKWILRKGSLWHDFRVWNCLVHLFWFFLWAVLLCFVLVAGVHPGIRSNPTSTGTIQQWDFNLQDVGFVLIDHQKWLVSSVWQPATNIRQRHE